MSCSGKSIDFGRSTLGNQADLSSNLSSATYKLGYVPSLTSLNYKVRKLFHKAIVSEIR